MDIKELAHKLLQQREQGKDISAMLYPGQITLTSPVWQRIRELREYTDKGSEQMAAKYAQYTGSLGYEHSTALVYIIDNIYLSNINTGGWYQVNSRVEIEIKHQNLSDGSLEQQRIINNQIVAKVRYTREHDLQAKDLIFGAVAVLHTHPKFKFNDKPGFYFSFFSQQDYSSLYSSSSWITGLITNDVWMLAKTTAARQISEQLTTQLEALYQQENFIEIGNLLNQQGYVLYHGRMGWPLEQVR